MSMSIETNTNRQHTPSPTFRHYHKQFYRVTNIILSNKITLSKQHKPLDQKPNLPACSIKILGNKETKE